MKLIFLDIDGVLNHEQHYQMLRGGKDWNKDLEPPHPFDDICPIAVENLNYIIEETGAKVVVSSTWRLGKEANELQGLLDCMGFKGEIIDKTPYLDFRNKNYNYSVPRGCEIKAWLEMNKGILNTKISNVKYVILDDDSDMLYWQRNNMLIIDQFVGLTPKMAYKAIQILNIYE